MLLTPFSLQANAACHAAFRSILLAREYFKSYFLWRKWIESQKLQHQESTLYPPPQRRGFTACFEIKFFLQNFGSWMVRINKVR